MKSTSFMQTKGAARAAAQIHERFFWLFRKLDNCLDAMNSPPACNRNGRTECSAIMVDMTPNKKIAESFISPFGPVRRVFGEDGMPSRDTLNPATADAKCLNHVQ